MDAVALTYDLAHRPEHREIMTAVSHLTGRRINRFTHNHWSADDLAKKARWGGFLAHSPAVIFSAA